MESYFCDEFESDYEPFSMAVQDELLARLLVLEQLGSRLRRF